MKIDKTEITFYLGMIIAISQVWLEKIELVFIGAGIMLLSVLVEYKLQKEENDSMVDKSNKE